MAKASVIITTHNRPHFLKRAVTSARESGTGVEIVVVDDASTDGTARLCQELAEIRYVRVDRNQRVAGARNIGLLASSGEYITFLDDDDTRIANSLDLQIKALETLPQAGLIYGRAIYGNQEGVAQCDSFPSQCPRGDVFWQLLRQNFIPCGSAVFRRSCLFRIGLLDDGIPGIDDWDLWLRLAEIYPVLALETPVLVWRQSSPVSRQGTSQAAGIASLCLKQFHNSWIKLPRAQSSPSKLKQAAWRDLSQNIAEHLIWESLRAWSNSKPYQAVKNLLVLPQLDSLTMLRIFKHRVFRLPRAGILEASMASRVDTDRVA